MSNENFHFFPFYYCLGCKNMVNYSYEEKNK